MKTKAYLAAIAASVIPLLNSSAQTASIAIAPSVAQLSPAAIEVQKLAQSGLGDDVVLSYIGQSKAYYNLSADNILTLKSVGVSSQAVNAMLNHDAVLRSQQAAVSTTALAASAPPPSEPVNSAPVVVSAPPATTPTTVVVQPPQPAPLVEVIPASPAPDYLWTPGFWNWNGTVWIWVGGHWHYPVRPGHVWVGGHWNGHGHSHAWVGGHWR